MTLRLSDAALDRLRHDAPLAAEIVLTDRDIAAAIADPVIPLSRAPAVSEMRERRSRLTAAAARQYGRRGPIIEGGTPVAARADCPEPAHDPRPRHRRRD